MTEDREPACVRKNPCASCPYRQNVPSGVWDESEYKKLPKFDGPIYDQICNQVGNAIFFCHHNTGEVCAGWIGHREHPEDLLSVRFGISAGRLDLSVLDYKTDVPLFESGREAAEHGMKEYRNPGAKAAKTIEKVKRIPGVTTVPRRAQ